MTLPPIVPTATHGPSDCQRIERELDLARWLLDEIHKELGKGVYANWSKMMDLSSSITLEELTGGKANGKQ